MFTKFEDNGEIDIYINGEVVAEEGEDFEGDMLHGGVNNYVSSSGGEDFDDSDSEYEYKMDEEKDEEEERAGDDWGVEGDLVENIVKKANDEKMGEGRVEDTDVGEARVSDTDGEEWSGDENLVWSDDELNSNKGDILEVLDQLLESLKNRVPQPQQCSNNFKNARKGLGSKNRLHLLRVNQVPGHCKSKEVPDQPLQ
ncbi:hypothetical protein Salat_0212500 [Sesamum alatum]|uniref:Uncharacterized protein n=1 Tax=Sesamum alatum TaxID=300844 RepID=A0AAE1YYG1_9LAMI|nr:hypothetical protein Salat_0212500 [Sesamum alatum]